MADNPSICMEMGDCVKVQRLKDRFLYKWLARLDHRNNNNCTEVDQNNARSPSGGIAIQLAQLGLDHLSSHFGALIAHRRHIERYALRMQFGSRNLAARSGARFVQQP